MEETHEPLRHTTALTIHADKFTPHCGWIELNGWIELTENLPFMIDSSTIGVVIGELRNHSKQTRAFLRVLARKRNYTPRAHSRCGKSPIGSMAFKDLIKIADDLFYENQNNEQ